MPERASAAGEEDSVVAELPGFEPKSPRGKRAAGSMYIQPTNRAEARNSQGDEPKMASSRVVEAACDRRAGAVPSDRPRPHNTVTCRIGHYSRLSAACNASSLSVASFF